MSWFEVDNRGFALQAAERGADRVALEIVSNSLDEFKNGCTEIDVRLSRIPGSNYVDFECVDDAPNGFHNLGDAYTLFSESTKRNDPEMRGQFCIGEKWFVALCLSARIESTKGSVIFRQGGTRHHGAKKRDVGTKVSGRLKMTLREQAAFEASLRQVISDDDLELKYNGERIFCPNFLRESAVVLPTLVPDRDGVMRPTKRTTTIEVFSADEEEGNGSPPMLFEMGIPVVEIATRWHVNVCQRVPLGRDRDNVTPYFRRQLLLAVAEMMHDDLTAEDATSWCNEPLGNAKISKQAAEAIVTARYGKKRATYDPSDREANVKAVSMDATLLIGRQLTGSQWNTVRRYDLSKPTGQIEAYKTDHSRPTAEPGEDGVTEEHYTREELTAGMKATAWLAQRWARMALDVTDLEVLFVKKWPSQLGSMAWWHGSKPSTSAVLTFSTKVCGGKAWFDLADTALPSDDVRALLIHELAHHLVDSHNQPEGGTYFYDACCTVGARVSRWISR